MCIAALLVNGCDESGRSEESSEAYNRSAVQRAWDRRNAQRDAQRIGSDDSVPSRPDDEPAAVTTSCVATILPYCGTWLGSTTYEDNGTNYIATVERLALDQSSDQDNVIRFEFVMRRIADTAGPFSDVQGSALNGVGEWGGRCNGWDQERHVLTICCVFTTPQMGNQTQMEAAFTSVSEGFVSGELLLGTNRIPIQKL